MGEKLPVWWQVEDRQGGRAINIIIIIDNCVTTETTIIKPKI